MYHHRFQTATQQILVASSSQIPQQPQILVAAPVAAATPAVASVVPSVALSTTTQAPQGSSIVTIPVTAVGTVSLSQTMQTVRILYLIFFALSSY